MRNDLKTRHLLWMASALVLAGCGGTSGGVTDATTDPGTPDVGPADTGMASDPGPIDPGAMDGVAPDEVTVDETADPGATDIAPADTGPASDPGPTDPGALDGVTPDEAAPDEGVAEESQVADAHVDTGADDTAQPFTHESLSSFEGAKTCLGCHPGREDEVMSSTHYTFTAELPPDFLYEKDGSVTTQKYSGKFWKLCGFPMAWPQSNWLGKLKDDPATPHVDNSSGCGKCHVGIGMMPAVGKGAMAPAPAEKEVNVDCLICHARNYDRKYYVATKDGQPELNPKGMPILFAAPRIDGVFDFSGQLDAARSVGKTSAATCGRCHATSGGGGQKFGETMHSFKRGDGFGPEFDVHAAAGMTCSDCHSAGAHKFKRARNNDLAAYDSVQDKPGCVSCHGEKPHGGGTYDSHTARVACTTCHATSKGGVTLKDFSVASCPPDKDCSAESMDAYAVKQVKFPADFKITYRWFNGKIERPIHPLGTKEDGRIYPFKVGAFNAPRDAEGHFLPFQWGKVFMSGDIMAGIAGGIALYEELLAAFQANPSEYGLPPVPGAFDHFEQSEDFFSLSHGITKASALKCASCHSSTESVLDWPALGLTNPMPL